MSVTTIMSREGIPGPVRDKAAATVISATAQKIKDTFGTDFKNKEEQRARQLSSQLYEYTTTWLDYQSYPWADLVSDLIDETAEQIQSGSYSSARRTLTKIRVSMYGKGN